MQTNAENFAAFGPPWVPFYAGAGLVFACFIALTAKMRLPGAELAEDERVGSFGTCLELLRNKSVLLFFAGIVAYVGTEQGLANWMGQFLLVYHGIPAETTEAYEVSLFWGLMVIGCMLGLVLLRLLDSQRILRLFGIGAVGCVLAALLGPAPARESFGRRCPSSLTSFAALVDRQASADSVRVLEGSPQSGLNVWLGSIADFPQSGLRDGKTLYYRQQRLVSRSIWECPGVGVLLLVHMFRRPASRLLDPFWPNGSCPLVVQAQICGPRSVRLPRNCIWRSRKSRRLKDSEVCPGRLRRRPALSCKAH